MSLIEMSLAQTIKKQYRYKLKANIDALSSLIFIQLLAVALSYVGYNDILSDSFHTRVKLKYVSSDIVILFTFIWAVMSAITITTKPFRHHDFTFISNRLSSSLSNLLFLATTTLLGSITALLAGNFLVATQGVVFGFQLYSMPSVWTETLIAYCVTFLYVFLFSSTGYLVGSLFQLHKAMRILLPVLIVGMFLTDATFASELVQFYTEETTFSLLTAKVFCTIALFFTAATVIWNRLEVKS
ncbi:hypothetical protein BEP19_12170 [Ammoniphilus oxalaticus]|uniref:Uncharacterized protein n=1 Tax=Ammoniphilus oxalaticus TaxID=66863 RepID=A0A419SGS1_9BACL|nr:hypothetical protein [Ammoniphilus oxalaticus]RKD22980.1 hypothetical protein BEP19_12170 [Ammoniphilus oxalaticus]